MNEIYEVPTTELDRLAAVSKDSQVIGAFLEWLSARGLEICRPDGDEYTLEFLPDNVSIERRLVEYFGINLTKVERERRTLLAVLRDKNGN